MAFRESLPFLFILALATIISFVLLPWISIIPALLFLFTLYFFRNPDRKPASDDPSAIISSADGLVIDTSEADDPTFEQGKMKRVAVFLSVFDVHVNRIPFSGKILKTLHKSGEFLDARHDEVDLRNESHDWLIETSNGPVVIRQLAGLIARRIIPWSKEGDTLKTGELFGMIRFGSRTDVYLPINCTIEVKKGDRVRGGETVIAHWPK